MDGGENNNGGIEIKSWQYQALSAYLAAAWRHQ